jgi:Transglutaminase-like superfamily
MKRLRRFLHLPSAERRLLVEAALLLGAIRVGLWLLPLQTLRSLLAKLTAALGRLQEADRSSADRVVWAVQAVSRYAPTVGTCLTRALAGQVLLTRRGLPAILHIGVVKGEEGQLEAHAWLESEDKVVIGGTELGRYTPLVALEEEKL